MSDDEAAGRESMSEGSRDGASGASSVIMAEQSAWLPGVVAR
jgi:hypothetical protein